jgi:hypothetical protein
MIDRLYNTCTIRHLYSIAPLWTIMLYTAFVGHFSTLFSLWIEWPEDACGVGSSDFPKSICFMWFWFGLEIQRLVYKKAFFLILNGFYLIWPFTFQKNSLIRVGKKLSLKLEIGRKGCQKKRNFALISKMCRTLLSRNSQRFFLRKNFFAKFASAKKLVFL